MRADASGRVALFCLAFDDGFECMRSAFLFFFLFFFCWGRMDKGRGEVSVPDGG